MQSLLIHLESFGIFTTLFQPEAPSVLRDVQNSAAFPLMSHGSHREHEVLNLGGELLQGALMI